MHTCTRRVFLERAAINASFAALGFRSTTSSHAGPLTATVDVSQKQWFDEWFGSKPPVGALHLYRFADEIYALTKPIGWDPGQQANLTIASVQVPSGFVTDFASVPRVFWSLLPRDGKYTYPAIVHDYLYWTQDRPREVADEIFKIGMEEFGIDSLTVNAVYWSVRAAGGLAWDTNTRLRTQGEKRILKRLPSNPLVRWEDWKIEPKNVE